MAEFLKSSSYGEVSSLISLPKGDWKKFEDYVAKIGITFRSPRR